MRALLLFVASLPLAVAAQAVREHPSAAHSSVVIVHNGSDIADAADSITIAIAVCDAAGRPIANLPVRIEVSGSRNWITPSATTFTDANGVLIANLTSTTAETKSITVIAKAGPEEVVLHDRPSVTFRAGPAVRFEIVHASRDTTVVVAWDFFGNFAGSVTLDASNREQ